MGCVGINAQGGIEFKAAAPNSVSVGEQFQLEYSVNANVSGFIAPDLRSFKILAGPSTMSSTSVQIINGKASQNYSLSYTYVLQAVKEGRFIVGPAEITFNKKKYNSNSLNIEVVKGKGNAQQNVNQGKNPANQNSQPASVEVDNSNLFVTVQVDRKSLYQGECLVATIKVYTRYDIAGFEDMKFPSYSGFFAQDIETPNQVQFQQEKINGVTYQAGVIKKSILFPQRSGEITIDPYELTLVARIRTNKRPQSIFDDFFGPSYQEVRKKLQSNPIKISVKPLPAGKPGSFDGAVGSFTMNASVDKKQVKANDAVTLKINISGTGNLKLLEAPKITFPSDFDSYDPKVTLNAKNSLTGSLGTKTFEYLMIPRNAGDFKIPSTEFSYFNTSTKQYSTLKTDEFVIHVAKGNEDRNSTVVGGVAHEDIKYLGKDIRFIKVNNLVVLPKGDVFFGSLTFYLVYIFIFLLFIIILVVRHKYIKQNANIALMKNRKANKQAKKRLVTAAKYMKEDNRERFYDEIMKAFWGYLSDKLTIPVSELSKDSATLALSNKEIDPSIIKQLVELINICEYARYAPVGESSQPERLYNESIDVISKLEQKLR
jgi:hypothetical protein